MQYAAKQSRNDKRLPAHWFPPYVKKIEMTTTVSEATSALSSHSVKVLRLLRERCIASLRMLLPQPDSNARGVWSEESIRSLTAVFELQRVEFHSELEEQHIHNSLVAKVIEELATRSYFHDPRSDTLLFEMEAHLRLLAAALRLYKYHGKSLDQQLHQEVYDGISKISSIFENNKEGRDGKRRIEDRDVAFLIKHCQFLLISIDSSASLARQLARRAIIGVDGALAGFGSQYQEIRPAVAKIIKRQRSRPKWHEEYTQLEDACWTVFASDIRMRGLQSDVDIETLIDEARLTTSVLCDSFEAYHIPKQSKLNAFIRQTKGRATELLQESGPFEEHSEYMRYGILDLLYQLSFRIRKRARRACFIDILKVIRRILEQSEPSIAELHLKAIDLWNRVILLGEKDRCVYGTDEDCHAIGKWIKSHVKVGIDYDVSEGYDHSVCRLLL
jgi:hypothetical protein